MEPLETSSTPTMNAELAELVPPERTRICPADVGGSACHPVHAFGSDLVPNAS